MKQALVLGLALAANAMTADQVDNELIVAPSGGKFGDFAKLPGKLSKVMFDEQADDELLAMKKKPFEETKHDMYLKLVQAREEKLNGKKKEESKMTEKFRQSLWGKHTQVADDEELFYSADPKHANKLRGAVMLDEQADDELLIRPLVKADDDEFMVRLLPREHFQTEEEYQKYVARMRFHRDDADDELMMKWHYAPDGRATPYDVHVDRLTKNVYVTKLDDDELFVAPQGKLADLAKKYPGMIMFDEQADDELLLKYHYAPDGRATPYDVHVDRVSKNVYITKVDDEELFYAPDTTGKFAHLKNKRAGAVKIDKQADDELYMPMSRGAFKTNEEYENYLKWVRYDAADDELIAMIPPRRPGQTEEEYKKFVDYIKKSGSRDDELFVAPSGQLGDVYKKLGQIRFDDQADDELYMPMSRGAFKTNEEYENYLKWVRYDAADDELLIRPVVQADDDEFIAMLLPRDHFKTEEEYQKYVARMRFSRDDAADDEFAVSDPVKINAAQKRDCFRIYRRKPVSETLAKDDELRVIDNVPRDEFGRVILPPYARDDAADDELLIRPVVQADDDELIAMIPPRRPGQTEEEYKKFVDWINKSGSRDDELFVAPQGKLADLVKKYPGMIKFDEQADDELYMPMSRGAFKTNEEYENYLKWVRYDAADDELRVVDNVPRDEFGRVILPPYARDDADDELIYLGHLIKNAQNEKLVAAAHTFDDDELRAEKPSHVKAQERTQMKSELPKMKRKMRPTDETVFLA